MASAPALSPRTLSLLALGAIVVLSVGGFRLWTLANEPSRVPEVAPDDDLAMLESLTDGAALRWPDRFAFGGGRLFVSHGADVTIDARPAAGGEPTEVARDGAPVSALAVAGSALWIAAGRTVRRVPVDGGAPIVVTDQFVQPHSLASDGDMVFAVDVDPTAPGMLTGSRVVRFPAVPGHAGAAEVTIVARYQGGVTNVVLDHGVAFWSDPLEGAVLAMPEHAAAPSTLVTERGLPGEVAVVGDQVIWVERRSESLWAVPRAGGVARQLAQDFFGFTHLVAYGNRVAWVNEGAIDRKFAVFQIPLEGGSIVRITSFVDAIDDLAGDGEHLFWLRDGEAGPIEAGDAF
jgi:hypothetical protein